MTAQPLDTIGRPLRLMTAAEERDPSTVLYVWLDKDEVVALVERAKNAGYQIIFHDDGTVVFSNTANEGALS